MVTGKAVIKYWRFIVSAHRQPELLYGCLFHLNMTSRLQNNGTHSAEDNGSPSETNE